jgi:hypothetical protein
MKLEPKLYLIYSIMEKIFHPLFMTISYANDFFSPLLT